MCTDCDKSDYELSGLQYVILTEIAKIGQFSLNWTVLRDVSGDPAHKETYTEYALNISRDFDIGGNWWTDLPDRRVKGISDHFFRNNN